MKLFFSYASRDESFIHQVYDEVLKLDRYPRPQFSVYFNVQEQKAGKFAGILRSEIDTSAAIIFFIGSELGPIHRQEYEYAEEQNKKIIPILLPNVICPKPLGDDNSANAILKSVSEFTSIRLENLDASFCAQEIAAKLKFDHDGLPYGYPYSYEKEIIDAYSGKIDAAEFGEKIKKGCPKKWPTVKKIASSNKIENPVESSIIGGFRDITELDNAERIIEPQVYAAALDAYNAGNKVLSFPEAGPRKYLAHSEEVKIGILVAGGIAPGVNAVLAGLMKRHLKYATSGRWNCSFVTYYGGFQTLTENDGRATPTMSNVGQKDILQLEFFISQLSEKAKEGGSVIPTSRSDILLPNEPDRRQSAINKAVERLKNDGIHILYVIGGDGSMKAAHAIQTYADAAQGHKLSVVGIPKTMDNDILWVWQSFGFLSAVQWATKAIGQLQTEARSNPRLCVVQLFGSDSGFVVSHTALATGSVDAALIPEAPFDLDDLFEHVIGKLNHRAENEGMPYGMVIMAETALPKSPLDYIDKPECGLNEKEKSAVMQYVANNRRIIGQTPDALRSASLKIVAGYLQHKISQHGRKWENFRVFTNEPRHLVRSASPSAADIIFGERLGTLAVDSVMAGYKDFMISQWLTEYVIVPLELVVLGRKRIPTEGIFWSSVVAATGFP